jgi:hypothetical protein
MKRSYVAGQRLREILYADARKGRGLVDRQIHLAGLLDGLEDLLFQGLHAAVPEERPAITAVDNCRRVAASFSPEHTDRGRAAVRKPVIWIVAGRAGDRAVSREAAIVEQLPPELDFVNRDRILLRDRHVKVQSQRNDEHCQK